MQCANCGSFFYFSVAKQSYCMHSVLAQNGSQWQYHWTSLWTEEKKKNWPENMYHSSFCQTHVLLHCGIGVVFWKITSCEISPHYPEVFVLWSWDLSPGSVLLYFWLNVAPLQKLTNKLICAVLHWGDFYHCFCKCDCNNAWLFSSWIHFISLFSQFLDNDLICTTSRLAWSVWNLCFSSYELSQCLC